MSSLGLSPWSAGNSGNPFAGINPAGNPRWDPYGGNWAQDPGALQQADAMRWTDGGGGAGGTGVLDPVLTSPSTDDGGWSPWANPTADLGSMFDGMF